MCAWEFPAHSQQVPWWECVTEGKVSIRVNRPALLVLCIGPAHAELCQEALREWCGTNLPSDPSKFSFQAPAVAHRRENHSILLEIRKKFQGEKEIWRSLIQVPAQNRANFNIRSAYSVKIWKSPKTMILQPVLAPVPVLIYPHYENVFLLCPTKYSGSPKLLHIQPQTCWVEGNNNFWPAI